MSKPRYSDKVRTALLIKIANLRPSEPAVPSAFRRLQCETRLLLNSQGIPWRRRR